MTRLVLVGYGVRGRQWARAIREASLADAADAVLTAVVDVSEVARQDAPAPTYATLDYALRETAPDAVIIATPPAYHAADTLLALERGLPVLCEKPLTEDLDEAILLAEASRRTGVPLLVGMNFRCLPVTQEYRRIVQSGELGELLFGQFTYIRYRDGRRRDLNDFPLTMVQPMLFEQSIHHLDLLRYVYGREVVAVSTDTWNPGTSVYRDDSCVAAQLRFEGGMRVSYLGTWTSGSNRLEFRWRTDFAEGVVVQPDQFGTLFSSHRDADAGLTGPRFNSNIEPLQERLVQGLPIAAGEPFVEDTKQLLLHLIRVVRGLERPGPTAEDHLRTVALLHACVESARTGRAIALRQFADERGIPIFTSS
jgi:predicted dehydrogenase